MEKCEKCLYYKNKEKCGECGRLSNVMDNYPMFAPNTNYDRIKSMSVEEMAELFVTLHYAMECKHYNLNASEVYKNLTKEEKEKTDIWEEESKPLWKQWLLQEVSGNDRE